MVKSILASLFFFANSAFALSMPAGDLTPWIGTYTVTQCIECPDFIVNGGANLKNLMWVSIGAGQIEVEDQLTCAQTNRWVDFSFAIQSDDSKVMGALKHHSGQCDWGYDETLAVTPETLTYVGQGRVSGDKIFFSVKRTGSDMYEVYRRESYAGAPALGFPRELEYRAVVRRGK